MTGRERASPGSRRASGAEGGRERRGSTLEYRSELRKAIRRARIEPEVSFLNITAMLDIMTIILVFLLKSLGESAAAIPQSDDLSLPQSVIRAEPHEEGIIVTVSKSQILVGDQKVMSLPGRESMAQTGVGAQYKRGGPNDLYIVPLGNALRAARETDLALRGALGGGKNGAGARLGSTAIVVADRTTPYRLLMEVLFTLGQSHFGSYHLMVLQAKSSGPP